jgi:hypothetical protein
MYPLRVGGMGGLRKHLGAIRPLERIPTRPGEPGGRGGVLYGEESSRKQPRFVLTGLSTIYM